ncbi:hypothetical protein B0H19DRAFT_1163957 [Mycena capillaripes]|nr:hypothetical protein B0H19DRAFT_1163957 [Mycena capillaripes]
MRLLTLGQTLFTLVALVTSTGCFVADWNETHIYNPQWPSHAKFHNGQTMSMGALLGVTALWYIYAPVKLSIPAPRKGDNAMMKRDADLSNLRTIVLLNGLYWVTQASGYFYPGSGAFDPIPSKEQQDYWLQAKLDAVLLTILATGWWLERRRIMGVVV